MFSNHKFRIKWDFWTVATILVFLIFLIFFIYPLTSLFISGFKDSNTGAISLTNFARFFQKKYYYKSLYNSFTVTAATTVLVTLIGVPLAYITSTVKIRGKAIIDILIIVSMLSPPFIGAYSWILLLGRNGVVTNLFKAIGLNIGNIYGFKGILLVFTVKLFPYIYMYVTGALKKVDASLIEAAENLGTSGIKKIYTIILPLIMPTTAAGALMVMINALADFGTPMLIGEGFRTMPVQIYSEFVGEMGGSANFAAAISMILVLLTTIVFIGQKYIINRKSYVMSSLRPIKAEKKTGFVNIISHLFVYILVILAIAPQVTVIYTSFIKTKGPIFVKGFSLDSYQTVFSRMGTSIWNTYRFALTAIVIIILLALIISYLSVRRRNPFTSIVDTITMFPFIIPGSVLGITLLLAFNKPPLLLSGTAAIIIIAFIIRRLPYTVRSSSAILYQISPSMEEASISLGYSPLSTFINITSRLMMPGVLSGAILSWITCINELSASVLLQTGQTKTMSVAIYSEVTRGSYGTAAALSTILTVTTVVSLVLLFKFSGTKEIEM